MRSKIIALLLSCCLSAALTSPARADDSPAPAVRSHLQHLLEIVARTTKKQFIVAGAAPEISWYGMDDSAVSYPVLLMILADNNLTAVEDNGVVNIIPLPNVRSYPTLTLSARDLETAHVPDEQVISVLIHLEHIDGAKLVPILRPLIPQWGHLSASTETNTLIMTGSFANTRRIAYIVRSLDDQPLASKSAGPRQ
jgi:general secretion pathway protein D